MVPRLGFVMLWCIMVYQNLVRRAVVLSDLQFAGNEMLD